MPLASHQGAFPAKQASASALMKFPAKQASASALMNQPAVKRDGDEPGRDRRGQSEGHICHFNNAKAELRNSWRETAVKMGRFFDPESKNQLTQREKLSNFSRCVSCAVLSEHWVIQSFWNNSRSLKAVINTDIKLLCYLTQLSFYTRSSERTAVPHFHGCLPPRIS